MTGYLKLKHLAEYSDLSIKTLRGMIKAGLPCYKLHGVILVKLEDFDEFLSRYKHGKSVQDLVREFLK